MSGLRRQECWVNTLTYEQHACCHTHPHIQNFLNRCIQSEWCRPIHYVMTSCCNYLSKLFAPVETAHMAMTGGVRTEVPSLKMHCMNNFSAYECRCVDFARRNNIISHLPLRYWTLWVLTRTIQKWRRVFEQIRYYFGGRQEVFFHALKSTFKVYVYWHKNDSSAEKMQPLCAGH